MKGKPLKGVAAGGEAAEEEDDDGDEFKELDLPKVDAELKTFNSRSGELTSNQTLKTNGAKLQRALMVMVKIVKYDYKTGKFLTNYQCVNVLVGPAANVTAMQPVLKTFEDSLKGTFRIENRIRAM